MINTGSKGFLGGTSAQANPHSGGGTENNARALGGIGRALSQMGAQGLDVMNQLQNANNAKTVAEAQNSWDSSLADFRGRIMSNPDPTSWISDLDSAASEWKQKALSSTNMNPAVKGKLEADWLKFNGKARNALMIQASSLMVEQAKGAIGLRMDKAIEMADMDAYREVVEQGKEDGLLSALDAEKVLHKGGMEIQSRKIETMRGSDPFALQEALESGGYELSKLDRQREIKKTETAISNFRAKEYNSLTEGIAMGDINTAEEVDDQGQKLTEYQRFKLKMNISRRDDSAYQNRIKSPQEQSQIFGKLSNMIDDYAPDGDVEDFAYADIVSEMESLGNKAYKKEMLNRLNAKRAGAQPEIKNIADWSRTQVSEWYKEKGLGELPELKKIRRSLRDHVKDGFLKDTDKMRSLGFSDDEIKSIQGAEEDTDPSILGSVFTADNEQTLNASVDKFAELWGTRSGDVTADMDALDVANKIAGGRKNLDKEFSSYDDPESIIAHKEAKANQEKLRGAIQDQLEAELKLDPKMTMDKAMKTLERLTVDVQAGDTNESWRPAKPTRETGKVPATLYEHKGAYRVINKTRDQITGFSSKPGNRMISLDFNDADNKSARGIEIKVPKDATTEEIKAAEAWARETQDFYKKNGINVPLRHGNGIKRDGRGVSGVFHTEPFFAANKAAIKLLQNKPKEYADIVGRTLGNIQGAAFIPPHKSNDTGAVAGNINERDFAISTILPYL